MRFGAIADDVTGGTDLASVLRRNGVDVVQVFGVPPGLPSADAVVISLKTRTAPVADAVAAASAAAAALSGAGAEQFYFKYCSTFDSTDAGNIGPVLDALIDRLSASIAVACPAYPTMARTIYAGHLFVGGELLSESPMRHHPLTPMTDANLVRVLGRQARGAVGLVPLEAVERGPSAVRSSLEGLEDSGHRMAIVDALFDRHIATIAEAISPAALASGGAALGGALGALRAPVTHSAGGSQTPIFEHRPGPVAILSGSCSTATRGQLHRLGDRVPSRRIDPSRLTRGDDASSAIAEWCSSEARAGHDVLVTSTDTPERLGEVSRDIGREDAASIVESAFGIAAAALAEAGVRTFIVAGGETSGAVMQALGISAIRFGPEIEPGVPWTRSIDPPGFTLALKSGNFGGPEFFLRALGEAHGRS